MSRSGTGLKKLADDLEKDAEFLCEYPSCSYIIPLTLDHLEGFRASGSYVKAIRNFRDYLEDLWNESSSAISTLVPLPLQLKLVQKVGKLILIFAHLIKSEVEGELTRSFVESLDASRERWEEDFQSLTQEIQSAIWKYKRPLSEPYETEIRLGAESWQKSFLEIIRDYRLLNESNEPSYLLRSGHRSFYFFSSADLTHPSIWASFRDILSQFMNTELQEKLTEILKTKRDLHHMLDRYSRQGMKSTVEVIPIAKMYGENLGAPALMSGLASLGFVQRDLAPPSRFGINRLRGPEIGKELLAVVLDDVATRGVGVKESVKRLERAKQSKPVLYSLIIDRSYQGIHEVDGIPVLSMMNRHDLIRSRLWVPEMLLISLESLLWSGLDLMSDPIREICIFEDKMDQYAEIFDDFHSLLVDSYRMSSDSGKSCLFGIKTDLSEYDLVAYLANFHILCWNIFVPLRARLDAPIKFLRDIIHLEKTNKITLDPCSTVLREALRKHINSHRQCSQDTIHRLIVVNRENLLGQLRNMYETSLKSHMGEDFKLYSEDELKAIADEAVAKIRERWQKEGRLQDFKGYEADLKQELIEIYKELNLVFGKQNPESHNSKN